MSQFLGTTSGSDGGIPPGQDDKRLWPEVLMDDINAVYSVMWTTIMGFENLFWPKSSYFDSGGDEMLEIRDELWVEVNVEPYNGGCNTRYGIQGVTRDAFGNPLGGCRVKCFRTSDDIKTDETLSDANGNFLVSTPFFPDAHYLVQYKATSPDVFGSSLNTLVGA